jgi:hypothetical protein
MCKYISVIQADSGGKTNILGDDGVGYCERNSLYNRLSNS